MMSATVDITGYTITSGSKPCLKERTETAIVMGGIKRIERPMVAITTARISMKFITVTFQRSSPKIEVPSPIMMPLTSDNVMTARKRR